MNRLLLCLLAVAATACNPLPKTPDEEDAEKNKPVRVTPTPTPKPGAWMYETPKDKDNKGGLQGSTLKGPSGLRTSATPQDGKRANPLDQKPNK